jgi:hypothetical protein
MGSYATPLASAMSRTQAAYQAATVYGYAAGGIDLTGTWQTIRATRQAIREENRERKKSASDPMISCRCEAVD